MTEAEQRDGQHPDRGPRDPEQWDAERVRALRDWLDATQSSLADRIGTRQQTVSEWETGSSQPRRMSRRLLHFVAEESGFYAVDQDAVDRDAVDRDAVGRDGADQQHDDR